MKYFEDFAVGEREQFGSYSVTAEEVAEFAGKYDPQPFHLSDEAAAKTHFGRIAASGWHTCSMTMAMLVAHMKDDALASRGAAGIDELRWLKPVYPGDTLRCETAVLELRPSRSRPDIGSVRSEMKVYNQNDEAVMRFVSIALIARRTD
ncbi:MaoC family dehydratase [Stakelama sp. CBK3Z-3]|uniref:MaoC family dehydratase n=1 Tax=Stakelama flava TaxID=2860338 RepID=A0ABS6XI32_9SPHN|nr:MaoC family dehydratase [Stakelama flava]MBW4329811.1 MaoC family dehydratase [Stakelama flava]